MNVESMKKKYNTILFTNIMKVMGYGLLIRKLSIFN